MQRLKDLIGRLPSHVINWMLKREMAREKNIALVNFVNSRPNWFRAVDEYILVSTDFGFSIYCSRWSGIGQTLIAEGQWEGLLSRTILACLKAGDVAIDIGANIGYDTLLMSGAVGHDGLVLAFEPVAQHMALLLRNIRGAKHGNVIAQSLALSDESGAARISLSSEYNAGTPNLRPGESGPSQPILVTRLDRLVNDSHFSRIGFVKIDIEGFEFKAIQGMGQLIDRVDYLACEVNPQFLQQCGSSAEAVFRYMRDHGFTSFCAEPLSNGQWVASDHNYTIQAMWGHHFDALFCREVGEALRPLIHSEV